MDEEDRALQEFLDTVELDKPVDSKTYVRVLKDWSEEDD